MHHLPSETLPTNLQTSHRDANNANGRLAKWLTARSKPTSPHHPPQSMVNSGTATASNFPIRLTLLRDQESANLPFIPSSFAPLREAIFIPRHLSQRLPHCQSIHPGSEFSRAKAQRRKVFRNQKIPIHLAKRYIGDLPYPSRQRNGRSSHPGPSPRQNWGILRWTPKFRPVAKL